jgi:hypothetical protein
MARPKVFVAPTNNSSARDFFLLAQKMHESGHYQPFIVAGKKGIALLAAEQVPDLTCLPMWELAAIQSPLEKTSSVWLRRFGRKTLGPFYLEALYKKKKALASQLEIAEGFFRQHRPQALFVPADRYGSFEAVLIKLAKQYQCRVITIPYAISSPESDAANRYKGKNRALHLLNIRPQKLLKQWVKLRHPSQIRQTAYGPMVFYTPVDTLALAHHGMLSPNPWIVGGGYSDICGVMSQKDKDRLIAAGVRAEKIVILGQPSYDLLYQAQQEAPARRQALAEQHHFDAQSPLILLSVPQLMEHGILPAEQHWQEIEFLVQTCCAAGSQVLLSLHPKSQAENYTYLEQQYPVKILSEPLREVIPCCDVFLGLMSSSTIEWGVLLGLPTIAFDFYGLDDGQYQPMEGLVRVYEKAILASELQSLLHDPDRRQKIRQAHAQTCQKLGLGPLDGQSLHRVMALLA